MSVNNGDFGKIFSKLTQLMIQVSVYLLQLSKSQSLPNLNRGLSIASLGFSYQE